MIAPRSISLLIIVLFCSIGLSAQTTGTNVNPTRFFSFSPAIQTNGYGINFKWAHSSVPTRFTFYTFDFGRLKHSKEFRYLGNGHYNGFVFGRKNIALPVSLGIGRYYVLGVRNSKNDVGVSWSYQLGTRFALMKPVYLFVLENPGALYSSEKLVKYNGEANINLDNIMGGASFFVGINQLQVVPGAYGKISMLFNWGKYYNEYHAVEIGALMEVYAKELPIMASTKNNFIYPSFYLNFNLGRFW